MADLIKAKYMEGRWVREENRERLNLPPLNLIVVGKAM